MLSKYKIHVVSLFTGFLFMFASYVFDLSFLIANMDIVLRILAGICFVISMFYYTIIFTVLHEITDITNREKWSAIITHTVTLISLYIWGESTIFYLLFGGSILISKLTSISSIDRQMKALCCDFDRKVYEMAIEEGL